MPHANRSKLMVPMLAAVLTLCGGGEVGTRQLVKHVKQ
jgi:hypothetical protein